MSKRKRPTSPPSKHMLPMCPPINNRVGANEITIDDKNNDDGRAAIEDFLNKPTKGWAPSMTFLSSFSNE